MFRFTAEINQGASFLRTYETGVFDATGMTARFSLWAGVNAAKVSDFHVAATDGFTYQIALLPGETAPLVPGATYTAYMDFLDPDGVRIYRHGIGQLSVIAGPAT